MSIIQKVICPLSDSFMLYLISEFSRFIRHYYVIDICSLFHYTVMTVVSMKVIIIIILAAYSLS
jgi:hypothetical protein